MRFIQDQILATTHLDAHGERTSVETLRRLVTGFGARTRLRNRHDFALPALGYFENARVVQDPASAEDWLLIADVYITSGSVDEALGGFSYSITEKLAGNLHGGDAAIYLPFPHYRDNDWIEDLAASDDQLIVGKWVKKSATFDNVALMASLMAFFLKPAWEDLYRAELAPRIRSLLAHITTLRSRGVGAQFVQLVLGPQEETVQVLFSPTPAGESATQQVMQGLGEVQRRFEKGAQTKRYQQITLYADPHSGAYKITHIEFADGTDAHVID